MLVACPENFSKNLNVAAKKALVSVGAGSEDIAKLADRSVLVIIGRKGAKPGSVPQVYFCFCFCRIVFNFFLRVWEYTKPAELFRWPAVYDEYSARTLNVLDVDTR